MAVGRAVPDSEPTTMPVVVRRAALASLAAVPALIPGLFVLLHLLHLLRQAVDLLPGLGRGLLRGLCGRPGTLSGLLCIFGCR